MGRVDPVIPLAILLVLSSCKSPIGNETQVVVIPTTSTESVEITYTRTSTPHPTSSATSISCDPIDDDFCIEDGTFIFHPPITAPGIIMIDRSYPYGSTAGGTRSPHSGVEFYYPSGTPIFASHIGYVYFAGNDSTTAFGPYTNYYGNLIILEHEIPGDSLYTLYGHLSEIDVIIGQSVQVGERIGEVGSSGSAIGSHLHFEVRKDPYDQSTTLNPELWLIPLPGTGVLSLRLSNPPGDLPPKEVNIQYFPDRSGPFTQAWQPEPYSSKLFDGDHWENIVLGNLMAGQYRITFFWDGILNERWIEIQEGRLTRSFFDLH